MNLIVDGIFGTHKYCNFREFVVLVARVLSPWLREHKNILIYVYLILVVCFSSLCFLFFFTLVFNSFYLCVYFRMLHWRWCHVGLAHSIALRDNSWFTSLWWFFEFSHRKKNTNFDHSPINCCRYSGGKISGGILVTSTFSPSFEYHSNKMNTNTRIKVAQRCNILLINTWCVCLCKFWHLSYERAVTSIQWNQHTIFLMLEKSD